MVATLKHRQEGRSSAEAAWRQRCVAMRTTVDALARRAAAAAERDNPPPLSEFDGDLARATSGVPVHVSERVANFTPTALETYASCPWESWVSRIAHLMPKAGQTGSGSMSNDTGRILHEILARLPIDPADSPSLPSGIPWTIPPTSIAPAAAAQKAAWRAALQADRPHLETALEEDWLIDSDSFWSGQWERWMRDIADDSQVDTVNDIACAGRPRREIDRDRGLLPLSISLQEALFGDWLTVAVEAGIGVSRGTRTSLHEQALDIMLPDEAGLVRAPAQGVKAEDAISSGGLLRVRGVIDRLDFVASQGAAHAVVIDYKTGGVPRANLVLEGEKFQLPLYLLGVREAAARSGAARPVRTGGALYLGVHASKVVISGFLTPALHAQLEERVAERGRSAEPSIIVDVAPVADFDAFLRDLLLNVSRARAAAARGLFPTAWSPSSWCESCDFRRMCRRDLDAKRAWSRRHRDELDELGLYRPIPITP
jgi:hypothetical protein